MRDKLNEIVERFRREGRQDYIGLWQLVKAIRSRESDISQKLAREMTLQLVRLMLENGFEVGNLPSAGGGFERWPDQYPSHVLKHIEDEWTALESDPDIGDIVWFNLAKHH